MSAIIYKISSPDGSKVYVGSSKYSLSDRKCGHKADYKRYNERRHRLHSYDLFDEFGFENCLFEVIETLNEATKEQRLLRERHWIEAIGTLGQNRPVVKDEERKELNSQYSKNWYEAQKQSDIAFLKVRANKQRIKYATLKDGDEFKSSRAMKNKKQYDANGKTVIECVCGVMHVKGAKSRHLRSKHHTDYLSSQ